MNTIQDNTDRILKILASFCIDNIQNYANVSIIQEQFFGPPYVLIGTELHIFQGRQILVDVYRSVFILNKGIIFELCPNFKMRISQSNKSEQCYDLMLINSENKFIDLISSDYSRLVPKIINISNLEEEISHLLLILPSKKKFFN
jgi:hypothetical protein